MALEGEYSPVQSIKAYKVGQPTRVPFCFVEPLKPALRLINCRNKKSERLLRNQISHSQCETHMASTRKHRPLAASRFD